MQPPDTISPASIFLNNSSEQSGNPYIMVATGLAPQLGHLTGFLERSILFPWPVFFITQASF